MQSSRWLVNIKTHRIFKRALLISVRCESTCKFDVCAPARSYQIGVLWVAWGTVASYTKSWHHHEHWEMCASFAVCFGICGAQSTSQFRMPFVLGYRRSQGAGLWASFTPFSIVMQLFQESFLETNTPQKKKGEKKLCIIPECMHLR